MHKPLPIIIIAMAEREKFTLDEVMDEIDGFEDDSEDDFDGYLDDETDEDERDVRDEADVRDEVEQMDQAGDLDIGENVEIDPSGDDGIPDYTCTPGCAVNVEGTSPISYFSLFIDNDMLEHIVYQTNLSADQFIGSHDLGPHSRVRRWPKHLHNVSELLRFLAIVIVMGIVRYPRIESHWSTMWPFSNTYCASVSV